MKTQFRLLLLVSGASLAAAQGITVTTTGVGIGTTTPQGPLSVSFNNVDRLNFYSPTDNTIALQTLLDGQALATYGTYGGNQENRLLLQPIVGKVGVGASYPTAKLTVVASTDSMENEGGFHGISISTGWQGQTLFMGYDATRDYAYINTAKPGSLQPLFLQSRGGSVRLPGGTAGNPNGWSTEFNYMPSGHNYIRGNTIIADAGGKVGIGTQSLIEVLTVNGKVKSKGFITDTSNWSDYVFADDYPLLSLEAVEEHIKTKRHLPGVPSEAELVEKGLDLGAMSATQMAQIEQLTLHLIALNKQLKAQTETIQQQGEQIQQLREALQSR